MPLADFWDQTPVSFINAMDGAALRQEREYNQAIAQAWHTAIFVLNGYAGKLKNKSLSDYLVGNEKPKQSSTARVVAFFHAMRSAGFPVTIARVPREEPKHG